ncbi:unnamed protein product [Rotaria sordida]|uniref:ubiquitinyl hydrolase 1 n=1 Tax=Rotaria sordida TaxID=392033 RepID=A0A819ENJ5_9BILA|nr:unnamed protein product [Rotaria sordida]
MLNSIEHSKPKKASGTFDEICDVPVSHYVYQWWIHQFEGITIVNNSSTPIDFKKKHRDQIRWSNSLLPFRRSGLWMTIKVAFHTILTKRLGYIGTIVYKSLITYFLTCIIYETHVQMSTDLLVHCIRKIVRRLNKIECLSSSVDANDVNQWVQYTKQKIQTTIDEIIPKSNWQESIRMIQQMKTNPLMTNFELDNSEIYQHSCKELNTYLSRQESSTTFPLSLDINTFEHKIATKDQDYIPSIEILTKKFQYTIDRALIRLEIWVELCLEQWFNQSIASINTKNRFEILLGFFEDYQNAALNHYYSENGPTDPIGYSRFILTCLTIIHSMHKKLCNDTRFERLKLHSIGIPNLKNVFEFLVLPMREDMIRARDLYDYFKAFNGKSYPDLLTNITDNDAFGIYDTSQSLTMINIMDEIRVQTNKVKQQKIQEVEDAKVKHTDLMNAIKNLSCACTYGGSRRRRYHIKCQKCINQEEVNNIKVETYESPLPLERESTFAVIFELQMPVEIRSYRDVIWQFINRPVPHPSHGMYEWLNIASHADVLRPFYTGSTNSKVKLVSSTTSTTQTRCRFPSIASASVDDFLYENSLKVQIPPTKPMKFKVERRALTPQLEDPDYKQLQIAVDSTQFVQNQVIAKLCNCPIGLKLDQYIEFGSFRSGHHLQWLNLLSVLEMDSLSLSEESVVILIIHSVLQYGPLTTEREIFDSWCSETHEQLLDDEFVNKFIVKLNQYLDEHRSNWQNELVLMVITMIAMRILTISDLTIDIRVAKLAMKCREIGEEWMNLISNTIQDLSSSTSNEINKLRLKLINVGISCVLTFSTHQARLNYLLSSNEHIISLLKAITTIHDNITLNTNQLNMSTFIKNMMKFCERTLVIIQPKVTELLQKTSYQGLNEFAAIYWAIILSNRTMDGKWQKRLIDSYDGWYDCQYESRYLSIDFITGAFLVDNMTIGFLPKQITTNELFVRVFGDHIFEVQPAQSSGTYITKHLYHENEKVLYEFHFNDQTKHLTIREHHIQTKDMFQLIPHSCFKHDLPDTFVSGHSHWWNEKDQIVKFRPVSFKNADFITNERYVLSLTTGYVTSTETTNRRILINQSSKFFQVLYDRYFIRLDGKPFVYMMHDNMSETDSIIHICLDRLGLAFQYDCKTNIITSREYSDMRIDEDQWLETLTGLTFGLLLTPMTCNNTTLGYYPYRKLIVPFGTVQSTRRTKNSPHQIVTIRRTSYFHQYFVFILNDLLKILQSTDSPTGWLYLALLHAMTSHPLPDQYTGMTGMERAFQLLYSAGSWSDQPYDEISLNILGQIASISPKINYYPEHLTCMEKIDWNFNVLPYSMQHIGYYLITKKLFDNSQLFNFMFPLLDSKVIPEIFQDKQYNEILLKKFYWKYRDTYNPASRLSIEMENDILATISPRTYQQTSKNYASSTNCTISIVDHLYKSGDVKLEEFSMRSWLPLSQWLLKGKQLNTLWIGMLKFADRIKTETAEEATDEIRRFECLLNFLHYIADICQIEPFFLKMLKTVLKESTISFTLDKFPPFIHYTNIQEFSIVQNRISCPQYLNSSEYEKVLAEVQRCLTENCDYTNVNNLLRSAEINEINKLLKTWQLNRKLRLFLKDVQTHMCSVPIEHFHTKISYIRQEFTHEKHADHHQIQFKFSNESIDSILLKNAEQKFHHLNQDHFIKLKSSIISNIHQQNIFPQEIFFSNDNQDNSLNEIKAYFHNHLTESWNKFLEDEQNEEEYPSIEQTSELLRDVQEESNQFWNEFIKSITLSHEQLSQIGLITRPTPSNLINLLQTKRLKSERPISFVPTDEQRTLLGGIFVNWTLEQQMQRALYFSNQEKLDDYKKEVLQIPHSNWIPSENISWLILELEMNITIREMQIKVANHMIKPNLSIKQNIVMQMNMGEGKTSVILPMLSVKLSSNSNLVRIIVLRSLFPTNYQSLKYKLGGLLNQHIFPFVCRRDLNFNYQQIKQIDNRLEQGLKNGDIILTSLEDLLSFDLLTIDKCQRKEFDVSRSMLTIQQRLKNYCHDVLDESDEILHVKYQLIYTIGGQQQVHAGAERWLTIQSILNLVKKYAKDISECYSEEVFYKIPERKSAFPQFRLQSNHSYNLLCEKIANDWFDSGNYYRKDKQIILSFILKANTSIDDLNNNFSDHQIQLFLIVRGLLSSEVLFIALKKRHRVNYGINSNPHFKRLMAVPFRAKDVASDRTEFGHPDVALILTHLSYYFSGLNDQQLLKCFHRLSKEKDPALIYNQWISYDEKDQISSSIQEWKSVNLRYNQQRIHFLFPTFRYNMLVINYFLNNFVFPREAKQFPYKLIASAWNLSSNISSNIITGFSGTNDTQLLLPVHICQNDLPELQKTDAIVVNNLLKSENESYQTLAMNTTSIDILHQIVNYHQSINVILDVGALFIDGTNREIAMEWLKISHKMKIDYVVYFDADRIYVCDRQYHHYPFATSPACERLDSCIFYLDDIHTRGADFKFPVTFKAALTLGNGLTKDRFVQAAMRMRKLGSGHSLTFWSSYEVHQQIMKLMKKKENTNNSINVIDILRWVYENTQQATWDGLNLWASQSLTFQRKLSAFENIQWNNDQQIFTVELMEQLAKECLEPEIIELEHMYGSQRVPQTVFDIYHARYQQIKHNLLTDIKEEVLKRLKEYGGKKLRLSQLLDEEQQKELEKDLEEEHQLVERPSSVIEHESILHKEIDRLCDIDGPMLKLDELPTIFRRLSYVFVDTTFSTICQSDSWPDNFWISTEFQRVIATKEKSLNPFLRPPRWIIIYRNQHLIFLAAQEANHLIGRLKNLYYIQKSDEPPVTTVRLILPRIRRDQSILVNNTMLTTSSLNKFPSLDNSWRIPLKWLAQLFVFNGTLYFENVEEQRAYCQLLSLCPKPRTEEEEEAFEKGWIDMNGFVSNSKHRRQLQMNQGQFNANPITFVKQLIENRNQSHASVLSHVGSIILNSRKFSFN